MLRVSHKIGIDANRPVVTEGPNRGAPAPTVADPNIIADTGAGWVRLNFVLGPWSAPDDRTHHQGRDWENLYRSIILGFGEKGLNIYGLIGHEAVQAHPGDRFRSPPEDLSDNDVDAANTWIQQYVNNFVTIVRQFHQNVKVFESFNEPDDWHGSDRNWIHPAWFGTMLQKIYTAVKGDPSISHVRLVSGPLQGLENNRNAATEYLRATYQEGKRRFGWGERAPFPFDGVGYHLYIKEAFNENWPEQEQAVRQTYRTFVDGMRKVIREAEGREKPLYISEIGWLSNGGIEQFQADNLQLGLALVAHDPAIDLGIWFCTQDFGGEADGKFYGLYRRGDLTPENRKPAFHVFKTLCESDLEVEAGLSADPVMTNTLFRWVGTTTERLNLRAGPGTGHEVLEVLPPQTRVEVLDEQGDWLQVVVQGKTGFVHRDFVLPGEQGATAGFLRMRSELAGVPLVPPASEAIALEAAGMDKTALALAEAWNRYGGLLAVLSNELKIDPSLATVVFVVESPGGHGFANDGRMIIRFENHIFFDKWGKQNPERFLQHFQFDKEKRWQRHQWRPTPDQPWRGSADQQGFHRDGQNAEWAVFEFARTIDDTAAKLAISMGAPQIMGFNHTTIGYESVHEMFEAFSVSIRNQILGFFDFVKGSSPNSPRLKALQEQDFHTFAVLYNGSGQAAHYAGLIRNGFEIFQKLGRF